MAEPTVRKCSAQFYFLMNFFNNKSIHKAHEGTQAYIDYKQWTIELGGTISHYNYTRTLRDMHIPTILTAFLLVEHLTVLKYSSISFCRVRKCGFLFVNLHLCI